MNRRDILKQLFVASGGLIALPSWAREWTANEFAAYHSGFSIIEQEILASVVDTIIPPGNSIGALSVGVDKFLQKLFENCYDNTVQTNLKTQLASLENTARANFSKSFAHCDQTQRQDLLLKFSVSNNKNEKDFFTLIKLETIRGFRTSKEVMSKYLGYKVAPGHYYGCVDVKV